MSKKSFRNLVGTILIFLSIFSFAIADNIGVHGKTSSENKYGGDAYTGIQNASAITANNTKQVEIAISDVFNYSMTFIGACLLAAGSLVFIYNVVDSKK